MAQHTTDSVSILKRCELQSAAVATFGKSAASWTGHATNVELREALISGQPPARLANGNGNGQSIDLAAAIAAAVQPFVQGQLDEERVNDLIDTKLGELGAFIEAKVDEVATSQTLRIEVKRIDGTVKQVGRQHKAFPTLLALVAQGENVFMVGPAGSFKTSAARSVSCALDLPFYTESMCSQTSVSTLLGYMDAHGRCVRSKLREAYENGGVYLMDEIDNGNANVIAVLNAALANGSCGPP